MGENRSGKNKYTAPSVDASSAKPTKRSFLRTWLAIMLCLILTATTVMAGSVYVRNHNLSLKTLDSYDNMTSLGMTKAIEWYARALYGVRGLFESSVSVERNEFHEYVSGMFDLDLYPGVQAFSYITQVSLSERDAFVDSMRRDTNLHPEGYPNLEISPPGDRPEYLIVKYGESKDGETISLGYDIRMIPGRLTAVQRASSTNMLAMSRLAPLISTGKPGFAIFLPVHANTTSSSIAMMETGPIVGFVSMSFEADKYFPLILRSIGFRDDLGVQIFDGAGPESKLMYEQGETFGSVGIQGSPNVEGVLTDSYVCSGHGHLWLVKYFAPPDYGLTDVQKLEPYFWLLLGPVLCLLLLAYRRAIEKAENLARRAARDAEEKRSLLALMMDNLPIGVVISSTPAGEFAIMNSAGKSLLGREMDVTIDRANYVEYFDLIKEDGTPYPKDQLPLATTLATGRTAYCRDVFVRRPDGSVRALRLTSAMIRGKNGKSGYVIVLGEDITKEIEVERARREFASMAAHQLKSPPTAVSWCAEMLLDPETGPLPPKKKVYVERIIGVAKKMKEIVDALLTISRVEMGTLVIEPRPVDIIALAKEELKGFKETATHKHVRLSLKVQDERLLEIKTDPRLVQIIMHNLVDNAIRYTPPKGDVIVSVKKMGGKAVIEVKDTGIGIPKDQQGRVFSRFFRADNAIATDIEGSGLGLSVVKTVAEKIGCKIDFVSEEGKGTVFIVECPSVSGSVTNKVNSKE